MRTITSIIILFVALFTLNSCDKDVREATFKDMERLTIFDYIVENDKEFSKFRQILEKGKLDKTMGAYNPNGLDYTLFLPTNSAIDQFISQSSLFNSFEDLLNNEAYVAAMARFHVVNMGIITNDFPFGALPELTLSKDYLTISFVIDPDSSYYLINNLAPLAVGNIEVSNGYIHVIKSALVPVTNTTMQWLESNPGFSIFTQAVKATGFDQKLNLVIDKEEPNMIPLTVMAEPDSVFHKFNINSFADLVKLISPVYDNYTNPNNPLYNYVGFHIMEGSYFLSNFEGVATNYNVSANVPVYIDGRGIDLAINRGKMDTIIVNQDTTIVPYTTFIYDESNILTQSGVLHFVNQIMRPKSATRARQIFEFFEEPLFNQYRQELGSFLIEDKSLLSAISWTGGYDQLIFVKNDDPSETAWNKDYLIMFGDFTINYQLRSIVPGTYRVSIRAHAFSAANAVVEVFIDGVKLGGLVDLTTGGTSDSPFAEKRLGNITFLRYEPHVITVKTLIPGVFRWDNVDFNIDQL